MAKRADVWPRKKNGRLDSWYFRRLRLKTKDATEARRRARLAQEGKWPPKEEQAATVSAAAFTFDPPAAPAASSPPPADPPKPPEPVQGEWIHPPPADWTQAASTAAAAESSPPASSSPAAPPQISGEQAAELLVGIELKIAEVYTQQKYYEGFIAPPIAEEGHKMLVGAYRTMIDYGGAAVAMPPWVNGLVVPALTVIVSSLAIVAGFRDEALKQKAAAAASSSGGGA